MVVHCPDVCKPCPPNLQAHQASLPIDLQPCLLLECCTHEGRSATGPLNSPAGRLDACMQATRWKLVATAATATISAAALGYSWWQRRKVRSIAVRLPPESLRMCVSACVSASRLAAGAATSRPERVVTAVCRARSMLSWQQVATAWPEVRCVAAFGSVPAAAVLLVRLVQYCSVAPGISLWFVT
jgi:hypothetical protein